MTTLSDNSYGSIAGVAALVPKFANGSATFDGTTNPTEPYVAAFIDQVSAMLNSILAEVGFAIPVTQADAILMLAMFVNQEVAAIVEGIRGSGRFGPSKSGEGNSRYTLIMQDIQAFIRSNATGFTRMGVTVSDDDVEVGGVVTTPTLRVDSYTSSGTEYT